VSNSIRLLLSTSALTFVALACGAGEGTGTDNPNGGSGGSDGVGGSGGTLLGSGGMPLDLGSGGILLGSGGVPQDLKDAPPTPSCADGVLDDDEACDDGGMANDDGCGSNCRYVEPGFVCPDPGEPCRAFAKCGDALLVFPEQCDDGGVLAGDGCSATCKFEIGWTCDGSPSTCMATVCGDGQMQGTETCEEPGGLPFDGCGITCQAEPSCSSNGCTSACGDGLIIGSEECDDGNGIAGDGCSELCLQEDGYVCTQPPPCTGDACTLDLPIIFRDFTAAHSDFGVTCTGIDGVDADDIGGDAAMPGIGADVLTNRKPTLGTNNAEACIASAASFGEWFTKIASNVEIVGNIVLFPNGGGGYVNRLNNEGDRFQRDPPASGVQWCADQIDACEACLEGYTTCYPTCEVWDGPQGNTRTCADYPVITEPIYVDGNPLFFPLDGHPDALPDTGGGTSGARIPEQLYGGQWHWENEACDAGVPDTTGCPAAIQHNFHFTSEIAYWFEYTEGMTANLTFVGDDDVWVFVNERLAVDLGGLHVPMEGSFNLAADGSITLVSGVDVDGDPVASTADAADFGLEVGGVYEVKVFHAERKITGSSFKLTLSGFNAARSECLPVCGDGIIAAGEQCDDGAEENTGGHNRCNANCTIGEYCGDGVVQIEAEQCDDADPLRPPECAGCRLLIVK